MRRPKLEDESSESSESSEEASELSTGRVRAGSGSSVSAADKIIIGRENGVVGTGVVSMCGAVLTASAKEKGAGCSVGAVEEECAIERGDERTLTS